MKKSDIIRTIQVRFKRMRAQDAAAMTDYIIEAIVSGVAAGDKIEIRGFGNWLPRIHAGKKTVHPRTGKPMTLPASRTVLFRQGKEFAKEMN